MIAAITGGPLLHKMWQSPHLTALLASTIYYEDGFTRRNFEEHQSEYL
jgi:hypothetical protein